LRSTYLSSPKTEISSQQNGERSSGQQNERTREARTEISGLQNGERIFKSAERRDGERILGRGNVVM
jgi:hypothetical protein